MLEAETLYAKSLVEDAQHATVSIAAPNGSTPPRASNTSAPIFQDDKQTANSTPNGNGRIGKMANDGEVGAFLHRRVREILRGEMPEGEGDPDEAILGHLLREQCTMEGCDDLDGVAFAGYGMFKELEGGDVRVPGGFSRIVDAVAAKVRLLYGHGFSFRQSTFSTNVVGDAPILPAVVLENTVGSSRLALWNLTTIVILLVL